jgi:hypothetical protein
MPGTQPGQVLRQHARRQAAVGDSVVLTCMWSDGDPPEPGDILETRTGRRYLILEVRGRRLACVVVDGQATTTGRILTWAWAGRQRRPR